MQKGLLYLRKVDKSFTKKKIKRPKLWAMPLSDLAINADGLVLAQEQIAEVKRTKALCQKL